MHALGQFITLLTAEVCDKLSAGHSAISFMYARCFVCRCETCRRSGLQRQRSTHVARHAASANQVGSEPGFHQLVWPSRDSQVYIDKLAALCNPCFRLLPAAPAEKFITIQQWPCTILAEHNSTQARPCHTPKTCSRDGGLCRCMPGRCASCRRRRRPAPRAGARCGGAPPAATPPATPA